MIVIPEYIEHYYRDGKELPYEEWIALFKEDLEKENEDSTWDITGSVWTDYGNGRDIDLNGHEYKNRTDCVFNKAKDLINDMIYDGKDYELIKAIESLSEEESVMFIKHIERVKVEVQKFILQDERDL